MCVKKKVDHRKKHISGRVLKWGLFPTSKVNIKRLLPSCLYSSDPKARKPSLDLDDFHNSLHEHPTLLSRKLLVLFLITADGPHDRRLCFAPVSFLEKNILGNSLFHHGLIRGSPDMERSSVKPWVLLAVSGSRDGSLMGGF